jgi:SAM-dependent methyltransferase
MQQDKLFDFLKSEANKPFYGWDFSYLEHRMATAPMDWSYPSIILQKLRGDTSPQSMLDMGTGGGEFFSMLRPFPPNTAVTEGYEPNVAFARARLEPMGVRVVYFKDERLLPFQDGEFELIINRHESYAPHEVFRILAPGGKFITQQVGEINDQELKHLLGAPDNPDEVPWNLGFATHQLKEIGFKIIEARECFPETRIFDAGAVVYYLKAIPWEVPDFTVEKYYEPLARLYERIQKNGYLSVKSHRFLVVAKKEI